VGRYVCTAKMLEYLFPPSPIQLTPLGVISVALHGVLVLHVCLFCALITAELRDGPTNGFLSLWRLVCGSPYNVRNVRNGKTHTMHVPHVQCSSVTTVRKIAQVIGCIATACGHAE